MDIQFSRVKVLPLRSKLQLWVNCIVKALKLAGARIRTPFVHLHSPDFEMAATFQGLTYSIQSDFIHKNLVEYADADMH